MPRDCRVCLKVLDKKLVPWSVCTTFGNSKIVKNFVSAFVMAEAVIFCNGMASGNQVATHIIVNIY